MIPFLPYRFELSVDMETTAKLLYRPANVFAFLFTIYVAVTVAPAFVPFLLYAAALTTVILSSAPLEALLRSVIEMPDTYFAEDLVGSFPFVV